MANLRPLRFWLHGIEVVDVRHFWEPSGSAARLKPAPASGITIHHDGVLFEEGDRNHNGTTLDEDLQRLEAIHNACVANGWGSFCYHLVASPNRRLFYTLDLSYFGAHVARHNHELQGLALIGDFTRAEPNEGLLCTAGAGVVAIMRDIGQLVGIQGHTDWADRDWQTECPGKTWTSYQHELWTMVGIHARRAA